MNASYSCLVKCVGMYLEVACSIHPGLRVPHEVSTMSMQMAVNGGNSYQLRLEGHGGWGPAVVVSAARTPSRFSLPLLLQSSGRLDA